MKKLTLVCLALSLLLCSSPLFAQESYTITVAQVDSLSQNLQELKDLITLLRLNLDSYKQTLQATEKELQVSRSNLVKAENESNTFILSLANQQKMLTEQSGLLKSAKKSLRRLRRKDKAKNVLFAIIVGALVYRR